MIALDDAAGGSLPYGGAFHAIYGGVIGAVVGLPIWGLLGYMVYRKKMHHPKKLYQTTPPLERHRPMKKITTHNNRSRGDGGVCL